MGNYSVNELKTFFDIFLKKKHHQSLEIKIQAMVELDRYLKGEVTNQGLSHTFF